MARESSRRYYTAEPVYETTVIPGRHAVNSDTGLMEACYLLEHPEGNVKVKVITKPTGYEKNHADSKVKDRTFFECTYGGYRHKEMRLAVFDEGHLKRVARSFVKGVLERVATGTMKTAVSTREDYKKNLSKLKLGL